jgi:ankyrin repeat protein
MKINRVTTIFSVLAVAASAASTPDISERFYQAIRNNEIATLGKLTNLETVNSKDSRGATPLMYAAVLGSVDAMKLLLRAGADPNAKNDFDATALIWAGGDMEKVRLLLAKGADVKARSKLGRTALMTAAYRDGGSEIVKLLASKGGDLSLPDRQGFTPLEIAAEASDTATVRFLLSKGVSPKTRDAIGFTPLFYASMNGNAETTRLLLEHGSDANAVSEKILERVKNGPFSEGLLRPLHEAVAYSGAETVRALLDSGANANALELRNMTPLTSAVSTDRPDFETIRLLLKKGADPRIKSVDGEDAIEWARKFGNPEVLALLGVTGASPILVAVNGRGGRNLTESVEKSVALLQRTGVSFLTEGGCVACHAQYVTSMAVRAAGDRGVKVNDAVESESVKGAVALRGVEDQKMLQLVDPSGGQDTMMYALFQLSASRVPASRFTDAIVHYLFSAQHQDGRWASIGDPRPPIEDGEINVTAMGVRSLQLYRIPARKAQFDNAIQRAAAWLKNADPRSTSDRIFQLIGLQWATGATPPNRLDELLTLQKADGGWAQTPYLASDAYATGQVLYTLHELGIPASDPAYQRGVAYLLNTQHDDGSWHVRSRAPKIQPYFESGFPHGHDQWISAAGTAWAVMGLAYAIPEAHTRRAF